MMETDRNELLVPGDVVAGRYVIQGPIAAGSMGEIHLALQRPFDRPVAIKILAPWFGADEEMVRRFHLEARVLSRLSHPNTVTVYDFGRHRDGLFIAMEYVRGQNLADLVRTRGPLPMEDAVPLAIQVAQSLSEAHANGVVHRDLKPENILVSARTSGAPFAKVVDFGIAKLRQGDARSSRALLGTPQFMAPEQASGGTIDGRADLYSLACCVWEMLVGEPPFGGAVAMEVAYAQMNAPRPHLPSTFPVALNAFLRRAMAVDPDERPRDAAAFIAELLAAATSTAGESQALGMAVARPASLSGVSPERVTEPGHAQPHEDVPETSEPEDSSIIPIQVAMGEDPPWVRQVAIGLAVLVVLGLVAAAGFAAFGDGTEEVSIATQPSGAVVLVDGKSVGVTPLDLELAPDASVELRLDGHQAVELAATGDDIFVSLERRVIEVEIEVVDAVRSARLVVNGEPLGAVGSQRTVAVEWPRNGLQIELDDPRFEPIVERIPPAALAERLTVAIGESRLVPKGGR